MFHYDRGLKLTRADLAVDFRRRQPRAFVSHAHVDHMARHEYALCTAETGRLYQHRFGQRPTMAMPYRQPVEWGGLRLTTYPAGHCLGSAMLLAEDETHSLLYTGDFKLGPSATAERAELPRADVLVIESTYGDPRYRHPPRERVLEWLFALVRQTLERDQIPLIEAYVLGKAQEVTRLLTAEGFRVLQHPSIYAVSQVYLACGVELGSFELYSGRVETGAVLVMPPRFHRQSGPAAPRGSIVRFAVTGWATHERTRYRLGVDHAIPLSDHADYDELFEAVERVEPRVIYCTHGPTSFVNHLRAAGRNAFPLDEKSQLPALAEPVQARLF